MCMCLRIKNPITRIFLKLDLPRWNFWQTYLFKRNLSVYFSVVLCTDKHWQSCGFQPPWLIKSKPRSLKERCQLRAAVAGTPRTMSLSVILSPTLCACMTSCYGATSDSLWVEMAQRFASCIYSPAMQIIFAPVMLPVCVRPYSQASLRMVLA